MNLQLSIGLNEANIVKKIRFSSGCLSYSKRQCKLIVSLRIEDGSHNKAQNKSVSKKQSINQKAQTKNPKSKQTQHTL